MLINFAKSKNISFSMRVLNVSILFHSHFLQNEINLFLFLQFNWQPFVHRAIMIGQQFIFHALVSLLFLVATITGMWKLFFSVFLFFPDTNLDTQSPTYDVFHYKLKGNAIEFGFIFIFSSYLFDWFPEIQVTVQAALWGQPLPHSFYIE